MSNAEPRPPRRWRRRLIVIGLVFGIAGAIVVFRPPHRPPAVKVPDPNGYDDLVRAGKMIQGEWPNRGKFDPAKVEEFRAFVGANKASLVLVRVGLGRECLAVFENSADGLAKQMDAFGQMRGAARLLTLEGLVLQADGRPVEAARSFRDVLSIGQAMTQGGMSMDASTGWMLQGQAITHLRAVLDKLPNDVVVEILDDLESLEKRRVSLDDVEARWRTWYGGAFSPIQRAMLEVSGVTRKGQTDERRLAQQGLDRVARPMRFFQAELAIHAFHEDKKTWPRALAELVPRYLPSVPIDPTTNHPIDYPPNPAGELTNDLSSIAGPNGEITPRP